MIRKSEIKELILEDIIDPGDLCIMLEITCEDILDAFEDRISEHYYKFVLPETIDGIYDDTEIVDNIDNIDNIEYEESEE